MMCQENKIKRELGTLIKASLFFNDSTRTKTSSTKKKSRIVLTVSAIKENCSIVCKKAKESGWEQK
jgi:aspartate carbamoyltransferase catalytic subunit